ncbi:MAG: hypothetical protein O2923_04400 [Verrucomicrobia bacterium]|nr:hypothetical protein [Verrucomicrobiota bacterium]MDA1086626.1 hypothetical protein [Verrucomicrobiota bacterium]
MSSPSKLRHPGLAAQVVTSVLFLGIGWALLHLFVTVLEPDEREPRTKFVRDYSADALDDVLARGGFETYLKALEEAGSVGEDDGRVGRVTGAPGFYATERLILDRFKEAGLEVKTQEFRVPVPVTEYCEILGADGEPLAGISIYPMRPAGLMPVVLQPEGITAELVATDDMQLSHLKGYDAEKTIVTTFPGAGLDGLASAGVRALVVQKDELSARMRVNRDARDPWDSVELKTESPFPIFFATGPLRDYAGQTVTLRCKVIFESRPARNLVGILRGQEGNDEAIVVTTSYDSLSVVPDFAPGAEQALSIAGFLELTDAIAPYRGQLKRDVLFVATAAHGQAFAGVLKLMEALDKYRDGDTYRAESEASRSEHELKLGYARAAEAFLGQFETHMDTPAEIRKAWDAMSDEQRRWFEERWKVVAGDTNLALRENALQARLEYLRQGSPAYRDGFDPLAATEEERKDPANQHPTLGAYVAAKRLDERSGGFMGIPAHDLAIRAEFSQWNYVDRMRIYLGRLSEHHLREIAELEDSMAIRDIFTRYRRTLTLNLALYSGGYEHKDSLAVLMGIPGIGTIVEPQVSELAEALTDSVARDDGRSMFDVVHWGPRDASGNPPESRNPHTLRDLESIVWHHAGYQAFTLINQDFASPKLGTPEDGYELLNHSIAQSHAACIARTVLALGFGRVSLKSIEPSRKGELQTVHGSVYGRAGTEALVASHPMTERTFVCAYRAAPAGKSVYSIVGSRGVNLAVILETNPYGNYRQALTSLFPRFAAATVDAARFDDEGRIRFFKDASAQGQSVFKNEMVSGQYLRVGMGSPPKPINLALFRAEPVALYNRINPQTLKAYKSVGFVTRLGLTGPQRISTDVPVTFMEPDVRFYVRMQDGAAGNEEIEQTRAFMLCVDPDRPVEEEDPEIFGRGYLVADTPLIRLPHFDTAASMVQTAQKRLALQARYHMADSQMLDFQERSHDWLSVARDRLAGNDVQGALNAAGSSVAYAINNHPVIRERISHAVLGIIWYLALLVPFVLFFEKLVFGYTDIRKQLVTSGAIFLVFFCILRLFHPAFQIVRSSMMILLGFIMLLLTVLVTAMVSGKFKQNLKELRGKEGRVEGADVNRSGVVGAALALGLNNMRRRKVRTGLTCATLVFITFAMICFTSVSNNLVDTEFVTGRSSWNGITIRKEYFAPIDATEITNIQRMYGEQFPIKKTSWCMPALSAWSLQQGFKNLEIPIEREVELDGEPFATRAIAEAALVLDWNEPMFSRMDEFLISGKTWFPRGPATRVEKLKALEDNYQDRQLAIIPDSLARELGISADSIEGDGLEVTIGTSTFWVIGIIDADKLNRLQGLDGKSILPVDLNALQALGTTRSAGAAEQVAIPEDAARIDAARVLILTHAPDGVDGASVRTVSMSILLPDKPIRLRDDLPEQEALGYREQRRVVLEYLERTGEAAYYAVDGLSYFGQRKRARTLGGLLELLVPLLIAALTVFNTMRGSVYERREEIYVYNAVGIAPNHVFFMFMAEAAVYAVMGAMLGYILSQGMGRLLTAMNLTGGLNLDYSSIETIFASWAIIAAVLLSTILPARDAARLASPSGVSSWAMPQKSGDVMSFALPFTFTPHDRLAVVSYFSRWLDSNGEGSSGPFFCAPPEARLQENGSLLPVVSSTIWLKPYDLGVSQRMEISLPVDDETGEYIAHVNLTRISGNHESWDRTVKPFLGVVRKQFLSWRATTDAEREEMFEEARQILTEAEVERV